MQWINAPASRERKLDFQFLTFLTISHKQLLHKSRTVDFHNIYRNWPATYTLYVQQYIYIYIYTNWMSVSSWFLCPKNGHYGQISTSFWRNNVIIKSCVRWVYTHQGAENDIQGDMSC